MKEYRNELGELHRVDGPAAEFANGTRMWWQNGKPISEAQGKIMELMAS